VIREAALWATRPFILPEFLPTGRTDVHPGPTDAEPSVAENRLTRPDLVGSIESSLRHGEKGVYARVLGAAEREVITRILRHTRGHQGQACELLGIDRKTLRNKLRELGIIVDRVVTERPDGTKS
jgi:two-component system nitrogen regulation response regulator GlnG